MTTQQRIKAARSALLHRTSPHQANMLGISFEQLRGIICGWFVPDEKLLASIERQVRR